MSAYFTPEHKARRRARYLAQRARELATRPARQCAQCGTDIANRGNYRYCGDRCLNRADWLRNPSRAAKYPLAGRPFPIVRCIQCGGTMSATTHALGRSNDRRFCSPKHRYKWWNDRQGRTRFSINGEVISFNAMPSELKEVVLLVKRARQVIREASSGSLEQTA